MDVGRDGSSKDVTFGLEPTEPGSGPIAVVTGDTLAGEVLPDAGEHDDDDVPPRIAGRYRVEGRIGEGGYGVVYRAVDERLEKPVAVKLLHERHCRDRRLLERFRAEALAAGRLHHPGIAAVTDFARLPDGRPYLVMEYVEGESLERRMERDKPFAIDRAARLCCTLCETLAAAHAQGIVHRDLKPANIIVSRGPGGEEQLKIVDFGIAKLTDDRNTPTLTRPGQLLGTPLYMAPEQVRNQGEIDCRADVYSVGIILYELVAGQTPFAGRATGDVMVAKVVEKPPPPSKFQPAIPAALERIILHAIEQRQERRFADAGALAEALAPFAAGEVPPRPRRRGLVAAVVVVAVVAAAAAVVIARRPAGGATPAPALAAPARALAVADAARELVPAQAAAPADARAAPAPSDAGAPAAAAGPPDARVRRERVSHPRSHKHRSRSRHRRHRRRRRRRSSGHLFDSPVHHLRLYR